MNSPITMVEPEVLDLAEHSPTMPPARSAGLPAIGSHTDASPFAMMMSAMDRGISLEQIEKVLDIEERWRAGEARNAFNEAKAAFKRERIVITKDKTNAQFESRYTSLGNLVGTVTPFLSKHGLSADWDQTQNGGLVTVICTLAHVKGHSQSSSFTVPKDDSGKKNAIQQIKSAITYARSVTFEAVTGLAASDANVDDDGNGFSTDAGTAPWDAKPSQTDKPAGPPVMTDDHFAKNFPVWKRGIEEGRKTPGDVLTTVSTRYMLTEAQRNQIRACKAQTQGQPQ